MMLNKYLYYDRTMEDARKFTKLINKKYSYAVDLLLIDISGKKSLKEVRNIFHSFIQQYTMLPILWKKWLDKENDNTYVDYNAKDSHKWKQYVKNISRKHFLHEDFHENKVWEKGYIEENLFLNQDVFFAAESISSRYPSAIEILEKSLCFPHFALEKNMTVCQQYSTRPLSSQTIKNFQNSKNLFNKYCYKIPVNDILNSLENLGDREYIIRSFEYHLGKFPSFKNVWEAYIQYLEKVNSKLILTVYSRFCRLFIDDLRMFEKYIQKIKEINSKSENVTKWWIDAVEFERIFISFEKASSTLKDAIKLNNFKEDAEFLNYVQWFSGINSSEKAILPKGISLESTEQLEFLPKNFDYYYDNQFKIKKNVPPCYIYFTDDNILPQKFAFRLSFILTMLRASNNVILQKLYQSCKYFFIKRKKVLCHRLGVFTNCTTTYYRQSLFIKSKNINFKDLNNITVTNLLQINVYNSPYLTSTLLSKIQLSIFHLQLIMQWLTLEEFELISGKNIQTVILEDVIVTWRNGDVLLVEDLINNFPNSYDIRIITREATPYYSAETGKNLAKLSRSKNIVYFEMNNVPQILTSDFFLFIKNFALPLAQIKIAFVWNVQENYLRMFREKGNQILVNQDIAYKIERASFM